MKAEISIPVAAATVAVVYGVYDHVMPNMADVQASQPNNPMLAGAERRALITSVAVAGAISLVSKDSIPFIFGAGFAVALSWLHRYANAYHPIEGRVTSAPMATGGRRYTVQATEAS